MADVVAHRLAAELQLAGDLVGRVAVREVPENLALPGPGGTDVWVTVSADGVERVLTYTATLPSLGVIAHYLLENHGSHLEPGHAARPRGA